MRGTGQAWAGGCERARVQGAVVTALGGRYGAPLTSLRYYAPRRAPKHTPPSRPPHPSDLLRRNAHLGQGVEALDLPCLVLPTVLPLTQSHCIAFNQSNIGKLLSLSPLLIYFPNIPNWASFNQISS